METRGRVESKSSLGSYESCPWQYKLSYIDKLKQKSMPALFNGINVHNVCERFFKGVKTFDEALDKLSQDKFAQENFEKFKNFVEFNKGLVLENGDLRKPLMNETKFTSTKYNLRGTVDVVFKDDNGNIIILDWKTGKTRGVAHHRFELAFYYLLIKDTYPDLKVTHWGIFFLDEPDLNKAFQKEKVSLEEIEKCKLKISNTRKRIQLKEFPKKPKYGCQWCGFFNHGCEGI